MLRRQELTIPPKLTKCSKEALLDAKRAKATTEMGAPPAQEAQQQGDFAAPGQDPQLQHHQPQQVRPEAVATGSDDEFSDAEDGLVDAGKRLAEEASDAAAGKPVFRECAQQ